MFPRVDILKIGVLRSFAARSLERELPSRRAILDFARKIRGLLQQGWIDCAEMRVFMRGGSQ